jgi:hypothetical protein
VVFIIQADDVPDFKVADFNCLCLCLCFHFVFSIFCFCD